MPPLGAKELRQQRRAATMRAVSKKRRGPGGRPKGQINYTTRLSREAIVEALCAYGEDGKGKNAMVGFCLAAIRKDIRNGVTMLNMITPKQVDAIITRTDITYRTIQDVDSALANHGLPSSQEIFKLDYHGSAAIDPDELAVIDHASD
jgi:hypothetical protein